MCLLLKKEIWLMTPNRFSSTPHSVRRRGKSPSCTAGTTEERSLKERNQKEPLILFQIPKSLRNMILKLSVSVLMRINVNLALCPHF